MDKKLKKYLYKIIHCNNKKLLKKLPKNSIDALITDCPYNLTSTARKRSQKKNPFTRQQSRKGFMNKKLDGTGISFDPKFWKRCFRVLKPGAYACIFSGCYDEETEVLTRRGWIKFPNINKDDYFISMNPTSFKVEWLKANNIIVQKPSKNMIKYTTNKVDLLVTENHNLFINRFSTSMKYSKNKWELREAKDHPKWIRMKKNSEGLRYVNNSKFFILPSVVKTFAREKRVKLQEKLIPWDVWLKFFGLWLAEGSASSYKNKKGSRSYSVALCHFNIDNLKYIAKILKPYFKCHIYEKFGKMRINDKQLCLYLRKFGKSWEKFIPSEIKQLSPRRLRLLLDWYIEGDGDDRGKGYTTSKKLCDDFQEIAMLMGISMDYYIRDRRKEKRYLNGKLIKCNHKEIILAFNHVQNEPCIYQEKNYKRIVRKKIRSSKINIDKVYCVELPKYHTLYVRRNGKAVWSGNSRTHHRICCAVEDAGFIIKDCVIFFLYASGMPKGINLKPAHEPIILAQKPISEKNIALNVLKYGTGAMNIDISRIDYSINDNTRIGKEYKHKAKAGLKFRKKNSEGKEISLYKDKGRWPANILLECCCDEIYRYGQDKIPYKYKGRKYKVKGFIKDNSPNAPSNYNDKDSGLIHTNPECPCYIIDQQGKASKFFKIFYTSKASRKEKGKYNKHPTVKPISVCKYLCNLITPPEGVILDPFAGTFTTAIAAEDQFFKWIGCEQEKDYCKIGKRRLENYFDNSFKQTIARFR